jgi:hypothetical protein
MTETGSREMETLDAAREVARLARVICRIADEEELRTGADIILYAKFCQDFMRSAGVVLDAANHEFESALVFYERNKIPEAERDMKRPARVVAPGRHAASTMRFMARSYPRIARNYRTQYLSVVRSKRTSKGRRGDFDPKV